MAKFQLTEETAGILANALKAKVKMLAKLADTNAKEGLDAAAREAKKKALDLATQMNELSKEFSIQAEEEEEKK